MHKADGASWQIRIDQPQSLAIGLFIRDVAAVPSRHSWLPLASPAVPRSGDQAPEAAGPQWDQWWAQALRREGPAGDAAWPPDLSSWGTPPGFGSLDGAPELQEIVSTHFFDAVRWSEDCRQEHNATSKRSLGDLVETKLVRDMERALGRTAQPFSLWITEIPVEGQHFWQLRPDHLLVTADLLRDTALYRQRLALVVEALF